MISQIQTDALGKLFVRLNVGMLMLFHGVSKILNPGSVEYIGRTLSDSGLPPVLAWGVYPGEVIAPLMIVLGIYARIGGLILAINMVFAIVLVHSADIFALTEHGGWALELQVLYLLGGLAVLLLGSGRFAVRPD